MIFSIKVQGVTDNYLAFAMTNSADTQRMDVSGENKIMKESMNNK